MTIPVVPVPAVVLACEFPSNADRTAGTFNAKAVAWANSENAMVTRTREIAQTAADNAGVANTAASEANASAQDATGNGAAQVALAAEQVELATAQANLATTNGAEQVTLATTQAELATTKAGQASSSAAASAGSATNASDSAAAAEASRIAASKLNLGNKTSPPTVDNQGAALLQGATYYDTVLNKWRVWTGSAWGDGISSIAGVSSVNGMTGNVTLPPTQSLAYNNRANLRSQSPAAGALAIVDGLGLFVWESGSSEPDDDESCFATATGRWLLQCVHWDVVGDWQLPDDAARDEGLGRILRAPAACPITSVAATAQASFAAYIQGAAVGSAVLATPTTLIDSRLSVVACVLAPGVVTVSLNNPSAAIASIVPANWLVTVFKEI